MRAIGFIVAGIGGFIAVAAGAAGTHLLADEHARQLVDIASRYLLWHAAALIGLAALATAAPARAAWLIEAAAFLFMAGMILFGGGLLISATVGLGPLGVIVPLGGTSLMLGWLALGAYGIVLCGRR